MFRAGGLALALGLVGGVAASGPAAAAETRTVSYRGFEVRVPAGWPVVDLDQEPTACVRFDRPAVYVGRSSAQADCPARLVGRSTGLVLEPLSAGKVSSPGLLRRAVPEAGVLATAYYEPGAEQAAAEVLATGRTGVGAKAAAAPRAAAVAPSVVASGNLNGEAFDTCTAPPQPTMDAWQPAYQAIGVYISGANRGCDQPNLTAEWVTANAAKGWQFLLIDVGLQAPCSTIYGPTKQFSSVPATAFAQGKTAAANAVIAAQGLGFAQRSAIYSDIEHYPSTAACKAAVLSYLSGWTQELHSRGYVSGVYSSASSGGADLASAYTNTAYTRPDNLWFAHWGSTPVGTSRFIPATMWNNHQRVHQYVGDTSETNGGVTLKIDKNRVDLTAPPAAPTGFSVTGATSAATLRWTKPAGTEVIVRTAVGSTPPPLTSSGTAVYSGTAAAYTMTRLANSASYAFRAWVKDSTGKVSPGADVLLVGTKATITAGAAWINHGQTVPVSMTVTRLDGGKLSGAPIVLYSKAKNATAWKAIATVTSDANGVATSAQKPTVSTDYQWGYNGAAGLLGTRGPITRVEVRPAISSYLTPAAIKLGATSNFYGYLTPPHPGTKAYLQRKSGTAWAAAGTGVLTANGKYSFVIKPAARGSHTYRVVWLADADHQGTQTPSKTITVS
ncbi:DUF1906 domain-containing protein [Kribbella sandramycini]|uniref:DUF1906 domain-containing protein n=1 Tax=Kribbella sandramycini TaxID=60450 RepID=A0A7Y4KY16_9ACTN|nr:DUF1906 domain-containing protein [Kribbella sandramycini]NOL40753.1 DUF1906 domain-containing protein [Kribbella sandramycini]